MTIIKFIIDHYAEIIADAVICVNSIIAIALLIPGDFPEKQLQVVVDFLTKISRKPE